MFEWACLGRWGMLGRTGVSDDARCVGGIFIGRACGVSWRVLESWVFFAEGKWYLRVILSVRRGGFLSASSPPAFRGGCASSLERAESVTVL